MAPYSQEKESIKLAIKEVKENPKRIMALVTFHQKKRINSKGAHREFVTLVFD